MGNTHYGSESSNVGLVADSEASIENSNKSFIEDYSSSAFDCSQSAVGNTNYGSECSSIGLAFEIKTNIDNTNKTRCRSSFTIKYCEFWI